MLKFHYILNLFFLGLVKPIHCQGQCFDFESGALLSTGGVPATRSFLACQIVAPCPAANISSVVSIDIYTSGVVRLARVSQDKQVNVFQSDKGLTLEGVGRVKKNGVSYLFVQFNRNTFTAETAFRCVVFAKNARGETFFISSTTSLVSSAKGGTVSNLMLPLMLTVSQTFENHKYLLSRLSGFTSQEAIQYCENFGGYLAEINSEEEFGAILDFIQYFMKGYSVLIGGTDAAVESSWVFQHSGSPVEFFKWHNGEPNNVGNEDCMALAFWPANGILMNDIPCSEEKVGVKFLCEIEMDLK
ncbi:macrophage mannose receptor 1-like [Biomphalaria glabrata]|uniref:Macrophage mannose receptor 1-like n=1 Tax=Biomphalaria glabrata TaxID=6526 RepID=A0A9W2YED0_BIOGL|nr:macrophage mannose receptor 1-like [Biomphalaria glabrata]